MIKVLGYRTSFEYYFYSFTIAKILAKTTYYFKELRKHTLKNNTKTNFLTKITPYIPLLKEVGFTAVIHNKMTAHI